MRGVAVVACCAAAAVYSACSRGSDPAAPFAISIEAPAFTRGPAVPVRVNAPADVERVDLGLDGVVIGELLPPYEYTWRTDAVPEGAYAFEARALRGGAQALSPPVTVVLDRTPPTVARIFPAPGADAWVRTPVEITFSEPIAPASVSVDVLAISGPGAGPGFYPRVLSPDGLRLSTRVSIGANPPTSLDLALLPGLTDLAGNALVLPAPWALTHPEWISVPLAGGPDVDLAPFHDGLVTWAAGPLGFGYAVSGEGKLALRTEGDWSTVEIPLGPDGFTRIAGGPGEVLAARMNVTDLVNRVEVSRLTADGLSSLGLAPPAGVASHCPLVGVDPAGAPLVATCAEDQVVVSRWTGGAWEPLGAPLGVAGESSFPVAFGRGGPEPLLLWASLPGIGGAGLSHVSRFDGTGWVAVGTPLTSEFLARLAADVNGEVMLARIEDSGLNAVLRHWNGSTWAELASFPSAFSPELAPTFGGRFWFGWTEPSGLGVSRFRFRSYLPDGSFTDLPAAVDTTGLGTMAQAWIAVDEFGFPVIAWLGQLPGGPWFRLYAWQKNI
jgi:hypothetical protein